jgi:hypothetical protein
MMAILSVSTIGRLVQPLVALVLLGALAAAPASALAAAAPGASCMGHEASGISPPGTSEEFADGMPGLHAVIDAEFPGVPRGLVYRFIAGIHAESHEACDEILEG